jgi:CRP-like cAMP-binding protein
MTEPTLLEVLHRIRFLDGIAVEDLRRIASVARLHSYQPGAVLFREGDCVTHVFLVAEGNVALEVGVPGCGPRRIHTVGTGELLGWSPVLDQGPMTATGRALVPTQVVAIDAFQVLALCHQDPDFGYAFMRRTARALAQRLNATRLQLLDVYRTEFPEVARTPEGANG